LLIYLQLYDIVLIIACFQGKKERELEFSCSIIVRESKKVVRLFDGRHDYFRGNRVFIPDSVKKENVRNAIVAELRRQMNIGSRPMRILSVRPHASIPRPKPDERNNP